MFGIGGSYVFDVDETLARLGWKVAAYVSNRPDASDPAGLGPIIAADELTSSLTKMPSVVAVATPASREVAVEAAMTCGFGDFPAVIDPTAIRPRDLSYERGALVNAGVILAPGVRLSEFVTINRGCSLGHDVSVEPYAFLGPSVVVAGGASIGRSAFLGAAAVVLPEVSIGAGAVVGAGAVTTRDVPDGATVVGNPARIIES